MQVPWWGGQNSMFLGPEPAVLVLPCVGRPKVKEC
jgi:hypothetical protein